MKKIYCLLVGFSLFSLKAFTQNGSTCDSAIAMNVPDTLLPYGASLDSGWTWNSGAGGWFKFTVPSGKGIEGFMIDMPVNPNCSTYTSITFGVSVFKGTTCATKSLVSSNVLFNFYNGGTGNCRYLNAPALFDSVMDGENYYINISPYPFKIRWFTHIVDSFSCIKSDTVKSIPLTGCNLANVDFMTTLIHPHFANPIYYTIMPTSNMVTFNVEATSCIENGWLDFYVYDNCSFTNLYAASSPNYPGNSPIYPGNIYPVNINNAVPGVPLLLVIDAGRILGPDIFVPAPTLCTFNITNASGILLPLHLLTFTAKRANTANLLNWTTAQEVNTDHFDIERSPNGTQFSKIGTVKANSMNGQYTYTDDNSGQSSVVSRLYYRLKMLDKDGQFTYSPIRQVSLNPQLSTLNIYPNPAKDNLQLQIESDQKATLHLQVLTQDRKVVLSKQMTVQQGSSLQSINISQLPTGHYFLKALSADKEPVVAGFEKIK